MKRPLIDLGSIGAGALLCFACDAQLGGAPAPFEDSPLLPDGLEPGSPPPTPDAPSSPFEEGAADCTGEAGAVPFPLRRLTNREYETTVARSFLIEPPSTESFPDDEKTAGFSANWVSSVSDRHVQEYETAAAHIRDRILAASPLTLRQCDADVADEASCLRLRISAYAETAYRRPLEEDELAGLLAFHQSASEQYGVADADALVLEVIFQSPQFLYLTPPYPGTEQSSLASRVSYFLTGGPPDEPLRQRAMGGELSADAALPLEVDRLLSGEGFSSSLLSFFTQWLDMDRLETTEKDGQTYPEWSNLVREDMFLETTLFLEHILASGGGLAQLLTSRETTLSPALAELYGVAEEHPGQGWHPLVLPEGERAGLLTQLSFLTGHAHQVDPSWVLRGDFVRRHLLCDELPPPPDVDQSVPNDGGRLSDPTCSGCHQLMDPIGQSFDRYDAIGRYSELDAEGALIDATGHLSPGPEPLDIAGPFDSPVALAASLAESDSVHLCLTRQMLRFALKRLDQDQERCALSDVAEQFSASGGDFKSLMRNLALSPFMTPNAETTDP